MPATAKTRTRKASTRTSKRTASVITAGQAWEALGADEQYKPSNMDASASNRMLWALNEKGKLRIV